MKLRKVIGALIVFIMILSIVSGFSNIKAATDTYKLGIVRLRKSGYGYGFGGIYGQGLKGDIPNKTVWKIVSYDGNNINYDKAIYCIKAGQGFGDSWTSGNTSNKVDYNISYDLKKDRKTIKNKFSGISMFSDDKVYSEVLWLLDNAYIPGQSTEAEKQALLSKVPTETTYGTQSNVWTEMKKTTSELDDLTDDEIEVVQQLAIWYFTNSSDSNYNSETLPTLLQNNVANTDAAYKALADKYNETIGENPMEYGQWKQDYASSLYKYLITEAKKHTDYTGSTNTTESPLKLNKDSVVTVSKNLDGTNYIVGPFKIDRVNNGEYIDFVAKFEDQDGNEIKNYSILDANKTLTNSKIEDLIGNNFYISIPKTSSNIETVKFTISLSFAQTKTTFLTSSESTYLQEQPVVIVEKTTDDYTDNISSNLFDLALRKFITKVDDTVLTGNASREPVISQEELQNLKDGKDTTAKKVHSKEPLLVKTGSLVTYTMRVYNEGNVAGCAKEITDYLPEGLEFYSSVVNGIDYKWKMLDKNGNVTTDVTKAVKITTDYLEDEVLDAFNKETLTLDYADVKVICKVVAATKTTDQSLRNIAAITASTDSQGNDITDRDSTPRDLTDDEINKYPYNPDNSKDKYEDDDDYEDLRLPGKNIDLALRKFIIEINGIKPTVSRIPEVDTSTIATTGTATYNHSKLPLSVKIGDIVTYTIRVYNEGDIDGYVSEITDFLPEYLEYISKDNAKTDSEKAAAEFNANYLWEVIANSNGRKIKTTITSKEHSDTYSTLTGINRKDTLLTAFDGGKELSYIDVQVKCKVKSNAVPEKKITNIAEITGMTDLEGTEIKTDRDSTSNNLVLPSDEELPKYKDDEINKKYVPGQEDDDDFEKLEIKIFDLALKKFITQVNDTDITDRIPKVTKNSDKTLSYTPTPEPLGVQNGDYVTYTIRVYNEGEIDGYASEITDDLPDGLEFLPANSINKEYRWIMRDKDGNEVDDVAKAKMITTDYLSKDQEKATGRNNLIKAYEKDAEISEVKPFNPDYKEVQVVFKVTEPNTSNRILVNVAQISDDTDSDGNPIEDIDSVPNRDEKYDFDGKNEDDIDYEHVKLLYFDLALRKFITGVNDTEYKNRYPEVTYEDGKIKYKHTKEPVRVENNDIVIYTIRVYNEGRVAGYAKEVMDDIPEGLEFLPDNPINKEYGWVMYYKAEGEGMYLDYRYGNDKYIKAEDAKEADIIVTDYLSKEQEKKTGRNNLIKAFDEEKGISSVEPYNPDYRDVKVAFRVTEPNTSDRIIINTAEIADDENEDGKPVEDVDSTPGNDKDGEDDIDKEYIYVKYFDLSLLKWVSQAIVTINGETKVTETGHTGEENPEPVVKVEIKEKNIKKVTVKFRYKIKVTNEGEIAGYAKEVTDYIPEGLKFVQEDNPNWYVREDGVVATDELADRLLMPGESATVEIVLTWINDANNMGLKVNVAEISKDYNDSNTPDIDSTPDNKKEGEDDIDDAPVILTPQTGETRIYYVLGGVILITMIMGIALIKKYVLE